MAYNSFKDKGEVIAAVSGHLDPGPAEATVQIGGTQDGKGWSFYGKAWIAVDFTYSDATEIQCVVSFGPSSTEVYPVQAQDGSSPPDVTLSDQIFKKAVTGDDTWLFEVPMGGQYMKLSFSAIFAAVSPKTDNVGVRVLVAD